MIAFPCAFATPVSGQVASDDQSDKRAQLGLPIDDPFSGFSTDVSVSTEENKAKTDFSYSGYFLRHRDASGGGAQRQDLTWKLGLSVPIGGKSDLLDKGTLDNLGNGTKVSAAITLLSFTSSPTAIFREGIDKLMVLAKQECANQVKPDTVKIAECERTENAEWFIKKYTPWLTLQMNRALYGGFWTLGAEGAVSVSRYSKLDGVTLQEMKNRKLGYSAKITFSRYFADAVSKLKAEIEYSDAPDKVKASILCKPVIMVPADDCKSGALTYPDQKESLVLRVAYARYFPFKTGKQGIGVEMTGSKDTLSKDWAVEVPIYFTIPGITQISPGVKPSYGSKSGKKDFSVNLFVKTAFAF